MKLFEGGILDKITSDEYEKMFQSLQQVNNNNNNDDSSQGENINENNPVGELEFGESDAKSKSGASLSGMGTSRGSVKASNEKALTALNLQMLQGAFYLAIIGYILAFLAFILEIECHNQRFMRGLQLNCRTALYNVSSRLRTWWQKFNRIAL
jgi:hypothetical protein